MFDNAAFLLIEPIIKAKIILLLIIGFGLLAIFYKKIKPWQFLLGFGLLFGFGYYTLVHNLQLPFWGLRGDEITIAAMYNTFAHYNFFTDFAYHNLPSFYPPLYFMIVAFIGKILNLNGIAMAKVGGWLAFSFFPIFVYIIQKIYFRGKNIFNKAEVAFLTAPLLIMSFVSADEIFGKPYELFAATAIIYWLIFFYLEVKKEKWNWQKTLIFGLTGGSIFMVYYLWVVFAVIALAILGLTIAKEKQWFFYSRSFLVLSTVLIFSLPFLLPLILAYAKYGTENWQAGLFVLSNINWRTLFFDNFDWRSLLMLFGFLAIIFNYKDDKYKPLVATLITVYVWYAMGLVTLVLYKVPMQEFRGYYFFMPAILAIGVSFALAQLFAYLENFKEAKKIKISLAVVGLIFVANYSIIGVFIDQPKIAKRLVESRQAPEHIKKIAEFLKKNNSDELNLNTMPELLAFVPINNFLYFNQHNSHPAANFSARLMYIKEMALARNAQEFYQKTQNTPYGKIKRLILYKANNNYILYYHLDKIMAGIEEVQISIPTKLVSNEYFKLVYRYNDYEIWQSLEK